MSGNEQFWEVVINPNGWDYMGSAYIRAREVKQLDKKTVKADGVTIKFAEEIGKPKIVSVPMSTETQPGAEVIFAFPDAGYKSDQEKCVESGLELKRAYTVSRTSVGDWHTSVWLEGFEGPFNSVNFADGMKHG